MTQKIFITGTDTDCGKTHICSALIHKLVQQGFQVAAFKPVAAGIEKIGEQSVNEDILRLHQVANMGQSIESMSSYCFEEAIAPHIAASRNNISISKKQLHQDYEKILANNPDYIFTEGAGGWRLPLNDKQFLSEFVFETHQKVILIVNMKLGCLNHAILTYEAIVADGLEICGWIANCKNNMPYEKENIQFLKKYFSAPLLAKIPYCKKIEDISKRFNSVTFQNCISNESN